MLLTETNVTSKEEKVGAVPGYAKRTYSFVQIIDLPTLDWFYFILSDMFKGLGTWLGLESPAHAKTTPDDTENVNLEQEEKVVEAQNEVNKQQEPADQVGEPEGNQEKSELGKGLGGKNYLFL